MEAERRGAEALLETVAAASPALGRKDIVSRAFGRCLQHAGVEAMVALEVSRVQGSEPRHLVCLGAQVRAEGGPASGTWRDGDNMQPLPLAGCLHECFDTRDVVRVDNCGDDPRYPGPWAAAMKSLTTMLGCSKAHSFLVLPVTEPTSNDVPAIVVVRGRDPVSWLCALHPCRAAVRVSV